MTAERGTDFTGEKKGCIALVGDGTAGMLVGFATNLTGEESMLIGSSRLPDVDRCRRRIE
jgi:hypothetical protein